MFVHNLSHKNGGRTRMRIKLQATRDGLHPSESIATINTRTGPEELVVDLQSARQGSIEVGNAVAQNGEFYLVELPSETSAGTWRVWVGKDAVLEELEAAE
jgi:hypothetical protein